MHERNDVCAIDHEKQRAGCQPCKHCLPLSLLACLPVECWRANSHISSRGGEEYHSCDLIAGVVSSMSESSGSTGGESPSRCRRAHVLCADDAEQDLRRYGGGKAKNMWKLSNSSGCRVPDWFCLSTLAFNTFLQVSLGTPGH